MNLADSLPNQKSPKHFHVPHSYYHSNLMFAINRLYKSAKSLLLDPSCQDITEKSYTNYSRNTVRTRHQKANMLREIEGKKESPRVTAHSSNKKRCSYGDQVENSTQPLSTTKKQKVLPLREKAADIFTTSPEVDKLSSGLQKNISPEERSEKTEICDERPKSLENDLVTQPLHIKSTVLEEGKTANSQHRRFGSEEPAKNSIYEGSENTEIKIDVEEIVESDDDSPEVMTNHESEQAAKMKIKYASKAFEAQKLASRQKPKELQKKKEEIQSHHYQGRETPPLGTKITQKEGLGADYVSSEHENITESQYKIGELVRLQVISKTSLPDLLPLEYLEDDETPLPQSSSAKLTVAKPRKIKFNESDELKSKDRRKGNTTYRVIKASSKSLAPKAALNARKTKEAWLQGRSGKKLEPCRRAFINKFVQT